MITNAVGSTVELEGETDGDTLEVSHGRPRTWDKLFIVSLILKDNVQFLCENSLCVYFKILIHE